MKNILIALGLFIGLSTQAATVATPVPTSASLPPSYATTGKDGSQSSEFSYRSGEPLYTNIQVDVDSKGVVLRAPGWISFGGNAAQAFFEQMTNPLFVKSDPAYRMIPATELRVGNDYFCTKSIILNQPQYDCSINMSDVRSGTIENSTTLGMAPAPHN